MSLFDRVIAEAFRYPGQVVKRGVFVSDLATVNAVYDEMMVTKSKEQYEDPIAREVTVFAVEPTQAGKDAGLQGAIARTIGLAKKYIGGKITRDDLHDDWKRDNEKWLAKVKRPKRL